ncbi:MAG: hypothetical protein JRF63_03645 [Deltaproteobacteria bacterium]|nr:hypothetical protein [Deltaproteobacteria bacterium]
MPHENVRMGGDDSGGVPWKPIAIAVGAAVVIAVVLAVILLPDDPVGTEGKRTGCSSDEDCRAGSVCLARGCLILLSSEHHGIWRDDVAAQLDGGVSWKPRPKFGKKVIEASECPAAVGTVEKPDESRTVPVVKITVFELTGDGMRLHKQMAAKGELWLDALRFWMPPGVTIDQAKICVSPGVDQIAVGKGRWRGKTAHRVDVSLVRAAPAGRVAEVSVVSETALPEADAEGARSLSVGLDQVFDEQMSEHTIVALPLGADVLAIQGPQPSGQRLLTGYLAYYWDHGELPSEIAVKFRLPAVPGKVLDVTEINP